VCLSLSTDTRVWEQLVWVGLVVLLRKLLPSLDLSLMALQMSILGLPSSSSSVFSFSLSFRHSQRNPHQNHFHYLPLNQQDFSAVKKPSFALVIIIVAIWI
jgi:hypothetical protein